MLATLRARHLPDLIFVLLLIPFSLWVWAETPGVPFHPDESTFLFMSADWELYFTHPLDMAWQPGAPNPRQTLRLLDAPLGRYLIGAARWLSGQPALAADWNWSGSWEQNQQAGALPSPALLFAGRMGQAFLMPFSMLLMYAAGVRLRGRFFGWSAAIFLGFNALFLLHARRAQAEGGAVFFTCLTLAGLVYCKKRPWWIAIPAALAFCAKQSLFPLAAVGAAAIWVYRERPLALRQLANRLLLYLALFLGVVVLLNPFLWAQPLPATQAAIQARQQFLAEQTLEFGQLAPDLVLDNPLKAGFSFLVNLFLVPPSFAEAGNYLDPIHAAAEAYLANPLHQLFRSLLGGGILFTLALAGCVRAGRVALRPGQPNYRETGLIGLAGLLEFLALAFTVTLPFQRYVVPLVPFSAFAIAYALDGIQQRIRLIAHKQP